MEPHTWSNGDRAARQTSTPRSRSRTAPTSRCRTTRQSGGPSAATGSCRSLIEIDEDGMVRAPTPGPGLSISSRLRRARAVQHRVDGADAAVTDFAHVDPLVTAGRDLSPGESETAARSAAALVNLCALERTGEGWYEPLWRTQHSEAWLDPWWETRDTGFRDHGSCMCQGFSCLKGHTRDESTGRGRCRVASRSTSLAESFSFPRDRGHRMEPETGAVTVHVYSPPRRSSATTKTSTASFRRFAGLPDKISPPSPGLTASLPGP